MPKPRIKRALEIGERVYLREPSNRDQAEIIARNAASRPLHRGWVTPPTDAKGFVEWMVRCRQPNVRCFLVCRLEDGAIAGVYTLSQIVRRLFQSATWGTTRSVRSTGRATWQRVCSSYCGTPSRP